MSKPAGSARKVLVVAWLGWTFDIMDAALFNFAKQRMAGELAGASLATRVEADLLALFLVGWSLGGILFGHLADRFGRSRVLAWTILAYSLFTALTAFAPSLEVALVLRFLAGIGVGGEWSVGAAWVAESVPDQKRSRAAAWLQSAAVAGPVLAAIANLALAGQSWRALFLVGALPAVLLFFLRSSGPRSAAPPVAHRAGRLDLKVALPALVLGTAGIAAAQNSTFWLPNLVSEASPGLSQAQIVARQSWATMVLHLGTLIGVFLVPMLCDRWGRKRTLLFCLLLSPALVAFVVSMASSYLSLLCLAPLMTVFSVGIGAAFALYFPELFPPSTRALGSGAAYNGGRILAALFPILTAQLASGAGSTIGRAVVNTAFFVAVGAVALLALPETRGRPLPQD